MHVWLSEFTLKRLIDGLGQEFPILHTDEHHRVRVDLPVEVVKNATANWGADLDKSINELISQNQRDGLWPKKKH